MTALSRLPLISLLVVLCLLACFRPVHANVEKTIFLAPARITLPNVHPGLDDLCLNRLSPAHPRISRALPVKFLADDSPRGSQHWLLLEQLQPGKRYEVRICWVATQPTAFWLTTYSITSVFESPSLITALANYTDGLHDRPCPTTKSQPSDEPSSDESVLFLNIYSAADFYTSNKTLMKFPPDVDVEIILDPFVLNIIPQSLLPTIAYLVIIGILGYFAASAIWKWIQMTNQQASSKPHSE